MTRKKDPGQQENIVRKSEKEVTKADNDERNSTDEGDEIAIESDSIKNANAAGLGAMGRSDQSENSSSGY